MLYHVRADGCLIRLADGAVIPACPGNRDYEQAQADIAADASVAAPEPVAAAEPPPAK